MDKVWNYKNFNMVNELDIAGEFIYDGIETLNQMTSISVGSPIFSFLYHISVGIERLQKIILVLVEDITLENYEEFEKSIITHSHSDLQCRIKKGADIEFGARENEFLNLLTTFYNHSRYNRFNLNGSLSQEKEITEDFILKYVADFDICRSVTSDDIMVDHKIKNLFGKVIGGIAVKYYEVIRALSYEKHTFTYELRSESKAEKIFLSNYRKNSLQEMKINEAIALKEFLVFLCNTKDSNAFSRFFKKISPLQMDIAMTNDYISEISTGVIPQTLIDEVEYLYEESHYGRERIEQINLIGNPRVMFEYGEIYDCLTFADSFLAKQTDVICFARKFPTMVRKIKDDDFSELTQDVRKLCNKYLKEQITEKELFECVTLFNAEAKTIYPFQKEE